MNTDLMKMHVVGLFFFGLTISLVTIFSLLETLEQNEEPYIYTLAA